MTWDPHIVYTVAPRSSGNLGGRHDGRPRAVGRSAGHQARNSQIEALAVAAGGGLALGVALWLQRPSRSL